MPPSDYVNMMKISMMKKYPFIQEHDGAKDMNTFLELIDSLEYSVKNGRTEEAIIQLREKIVNMFNDACWKNEAQLMETVPKDGTEILVEYERDKGFDLITWSESDSGYIDQWLDQYGKVAKWCFIRWWPLPKQEKKKHFCKCPNHPIKCFTNEIGGLNLMSTHNKVSYVTQVIACPFCGEPAEGERLDE